MRTYTFLIIGFIAISFITVRAQVIHVPADHPTIQEAIEAANSGDTVLVEEGTYFEQIDFLGKKPLVVTSRFLFDGDVNHISNTIIDGSLASNPEESSVVYFTSLEDTTAVLCGFTIQGGEGTLIPENLLAGGGIFIRAAGPTIRDNIITGNVLDDQIFGTNGGVIGGGIYIFNSTTRWSVLKNNDISGNVITTANGQCGGAALFSFGNAILEDNTFSGNAVLRADESSGNTFGGAIYFASNSTPPKQLRLIGNTFQNNMVLGKNGYGGAVCVSTGKLLCTGNLFYANFISGPEPQDFGGGGMAVIGLDPGSEFSGNTFMYNYSPSNGGGLWLNANAGWNVVENNRFYFNIANYGGALATNFSNVVLQNNVYYQNESELGGGAVYLVGDNPSDNHNAGLINNSFYANKVNHPSGAGGALLTNGVNPIILNSIFWRDTAAFAPEVKGNTNFIEFAYCNVDPSKVSNPSFAVIFGDRMIDEDPLFSDTLLNLSVESPCIDVGLESYTCHDTTWTAPLYDIDGLFRPWPELFDLGAHEFGSTQVGIREPRAPISGFNIQSYPNPFNQFTAFEYYLDKEGYVKLSVYNQSGQLVDVLVNGYQSAGPQHVEWKPGRLPSGIYFYKMTTNDNSHLETGKLVKL